MKFASRTAYCNCFRYSITSAMKLFDQMFSPISALVNRYLQCIEDFCQILPEDRRDLPLSHEQNERIWLDAVSGPSRYGYAYGLPQQTFHEFYSELEGLGNFSGDESRETILTLKQQIAEISSKAKASQAKERQRDIQYA
ncbi:hypothetical protein CQW23_03031 [Capsicum baccatum]|uniref:Uncharacterized protein n=1 Tax=Capsicum baccatum TaxID=33114 RepID=A0A2G2XT61_CAPBA|nr:hypothetical protein CQW23_03031 [Capsicum baccatum]